MNGGKLRLPPLDPIMREIADDPTLNRVLCCGRQRGKSHTLSSIASERAFRGGDVWIVSPSFPQSDHIASIAREPLGMVPAIAWSESRRTFSFPSGGTLTFKSADQRDNLRGFTLDMIALDEFGHVTNGRELLMMLGPSLAVRRGRFVIAGTPDKCDDEFHDCVRRGDPEHPSHDPDWRTWVVPSEGSPYISAERLAHLRRGTYELDWRREYCAEFVSTAGALVPRSAIVEREPPAKLRIAMGVDLAISTKASADYTACVVLGRADDGALYVLDAQQRRVGFKDAIAFVREVAKEWSPSTVEVEQVAFSAAHVETLMRETLLPVRGVKVTTDKVTRFQALAARYEQHLIFHKPGLDRSFADCITSFPHGRHDDYADALGLSFGGLATRSYPDLLEAGMRNVFGPDAFDDDRRHVW